MGSNQWMRRLEVQTPVQQQVQVQENQMAGNVNADAVRVQQEHNEQQHNQEQNQQQAARRAVEQEMPPAQVIQTYSLQSLDGIRRPEYMGERVIRHIFRGEINRRGMAVGYHYEGIQGAEGHVVSERSGPDSFGVYTARVRVNDTDKIAYSTFFPTSMSPQDVVDCIEQAYGNKRQITGNLFRGIADNNMVIEMRIDADIISTAYPLTEERQREIERQNQQQNQQ